ncbi:hypothetical protein D6853_03970 [Butyrivibrio sp. X503]|uniref:hypothetical protein n=1 Tax=Butyrivibrio sp. X503 TaxID=2364878 RepID=UPI000EAAACC8|nr:hypothetical protein [Butyrivibrio sp. X503]RKM57182.1 hypothetical protein D6853_03970 [Butyrivibrio sp. X503]
MLGKVSKGEYGYITYRKKFALIITVITLAITIGIYLTGIIMYKSPKSAFSIIAALGCLPTGWCGVNLFMFIKAKACSAEDHKKIENCRGGLLIRYDHVITSYDKNYYVNASTVLDKNICCYSSDDDMDISDCEAHIKKMMAQGGYSSYSIKIFTDIDKYCDRLLQLEKMRIDKNIDPKAIEDAWIPGTTQTAASILLSISL